MAVPSVPPRNLPNAGTTSRNGSIIRLSREDQEALITTPTSYLTMVDLKEIQNFFKRHENLVHSKSPVAFQGFATAQNDGNLWQRKWYESMG